ncbi:MAG: HAMP domain-containing protein, partial [Chloroflexi bacterium]
MRSIQGQLRSLFAAFFLLVAVSAGTTFLTLKLHAADAAVINIAGRQRMLIQQMTSLAIQIGEGLPLQDQLSTAAQVFEDSLQALKNGGPILSLSGENLLLPQTKDDAVLQKLDQLQITWDEYRSNLDTLLNEPAGSQSSISAIDTLSPQLLNQADQAVSLYQENAEGKVKALVTVQALFFLSAMGLLVLGRTITRISLLSPLIGLGHSAERIGKGDLSTAVEVKGADEVRRVAQQIETMRLELRASQQRLIQWAYSLEERVLDRTHELDALYQVSQEISSHLDVNRVLNSITEKTRSLLGAETAILCMLENEQRVLSLQAYSGGDQTVKGFVSPVDSPTVQDTFTVKCAHNCTAHGCSGSCQIIADAYRASHIAAPLMVDNRITGALCIGSRNPDAFGEEAPMLLTRLSKVAAVALENADLYNQAERVAALEERQRIAADIHDGLAQTISYLGLIVDQASDNIEMGQMDRALDYLEQARQGLEWASTDVRQSIASLQDEVPPNQSIQAHLRELVREFSEAEPESINWDIQFDGEIFLSSEETRQVLGIAREALLNARNHGGATHITMKLRVEELKAKLLIADNGAGFTLDQPPTDGKQHFGLNIL